MLKMKRVSFLLQEEKKNSSLRVVKTYLLREIDDTLYKHNAVLEACTFGIEDDNYGEEISACVYLKDDLVANEEELLDLCKADLGEYKTPRQIIFVDEPFQKVHLEKFKDLKLQVNTARLRITI